MADISLDQGISLSYPRAAVRGPARQTAGPGRAWSRGGGYYLGKPPDEISIADIICAVDEWVEFTRCGGRKNCRDGKRCLTHDLWDRLSSEIFGFLDGISLADLMRRGLGESIEADPASRSVPGRKKAA